MRNYFIFFITLSLIYSCSVSIPEKTSKPKIDYLENLKIYLSENLVDLNNNSQIENTTLTNINWINETYESNKFSPIWIDDSLELNDNGKELLNIISNSYLYGLDTNRYHSNNIKTIYNNLKKIKKDQRYKSIYKLEVLLTNSYFLFGKDINYGILAKDSSLLISDIPRKEFNINLPKILINSFKSDSVIPKLLNLQPQQKEYIKLQKEFKSYLSFASLSKEKVEVKNFRKDSTAAFVQSKKALKLHNYLLDDTTTSSYFLALGKFQTQHGLKPDKLIGKNTAQALSKSPYHYYKKSIMSLEKWRWRNEWNDDYIFVNIPSFEMKVYQNNKVKKALNVVVGKPKTATPEIDDEMEYLIVYPFWNLPYSISSKEVLPKIKKDSTYLSRNGYELMNKKYKPINSKTIDWSKVTANNFNYKIRQKGGGSNSLGLIKFIFPNKHSVYFHDTPSKRYFKNDIRDYSHGCVRVQHPLELAELILAQDNNNYSIDSVNTYIGRKKKKTMTLKTNIPVHIQYFTCGTDTNNNIVFYKDIYNLDIKLEELMGLNN